MTDIEEMLNHLKELDARLELAQIDKKRAELKVIPQSVRQELDDIETEFQPIFDGINEAIKVIEEQIKLATVKHGKTIKGQYTAVWVKGRIKWDNQGLTRYARNNPEIERFKTTGKPSVRILRKPFL